MTATSRDRLVARALMLEYASVGWGVVSASWSVTARLTAGSLGVVGVGLNVIADLLSESNDR